MLSDREISAAIGSTAHDANGDKIGTVEHFFVDDRTGEPSWVAVTTGLFGTGHSIVPALDATWADGGLRLPVSGDAVKGAPHLTGDHLTPDEEATLRRHYGIDGPGGVAAPGPGDGSPAPVEAAGDRTYDAAGGHRSPGTGTDGAMTRSEERLRIGTERVATTRVRLIKYVVTEDVQITVPLRREEFRVEEVPLDAPDEGPGESLLPGGEAPPPATGTGSPGGLPSEIILHAERPVVTVEVVPTERVRLRTELVEGQETVTGQVQREQIVVDQDTVPRRGG
jgi:stress response protein YsnF